MGAAPRETDRRANRRRGHIFLSFKTEEVETARKVKDRFEALGFQVWWQEQVQCAAEWHGEIDRAVLDAGCIVVLWSARAMRSPWVRHEASQAIARGVYAPARLELVEIEPPFNRLQAVDLHRWSGDASDPGMLALCARVDALMPITRSWSWRLAAAAYRARGVLAAIAVALATMIALAVLVIATRSVLLRQAEGTEEMDRILHALDGAYVSASLTVDHLPALDAYCERVHGALRGAGLADAIERGAVARGNGSPDGSLQSVQILLDKDLAPDRNQEPIPYYLFHFLDVDLRLHAGLLTHAPRPDLTIPARVDSELSPEQMPPNVYLDLGSCRFEIEIEHGSSREQWRDATGAIASSNDLELATFEAQVVDIVKRGDRDPEVSAARRALRIRSVRVRAGGRTFGPRDRPPASDGADSLLRGRLIEVSR